MAKKTDKEIGEFSRIFGNTPRNRILEFFLEMRELDFAISDVAEETGLNRATTYNTMETMIKNEFVMPSRKISNTMLYKLNAKKKEVKLLIWVFNCILKSIVEEKAAEVVYKVK